MTKPPKIIRPTKLTMNLPEDIRAKLDLFLYSETEQRVPFGAYQRFFIERMQEFFDQKPKVTVAAIQEWAAKLDSVPNQTGHFNSDLILIWEFYRSRNFS